MEQDDTIFFLFTDIFNILPCSTHFNNYCVLSDHEVYKTIKTRKRRRRKHKNEKFTSEQDCHESFHMDCQCVFHLLDSTLGICYTQKIISGIALRQRFMYDCCWFVFLHFSHTWPSN